MTQATTFVLIHGAGHDSWCWHRLVAALMQEDHPVVCVDLPCSDPALGLADYTNVVLDAIEREEGPLALVAHSLAGLTAPMVAARRPVEQLVFLGAIISEPGKSLSDLGEVDADRDVALTKDVDFAVQDDGTFIFTEHGARTHLYEDCDEATIVEAIGHLRSQMSMWTQVCDIDDWPDTKIRSIVCSKDRIVEPEWSLWIARERLGIEPELIEGGHSPFLSKPAELAELLVSG